MQWCEIMNMWCSDMDDEDVENCHCDGDCGRCEQCSDVGRNKGALNKNLFDNAFRVPLETHS